MGNLRLIAVILVMLENDWRFTKIVPLGGFRNSVALIFCSLKTPLFFMKFSRKTWKLSQQLTKFTDKKFITNHYFKRVQIFHLLSTKVSIFEKKAALHGGNSSRVCHANTRKKWKTSNFGHFNKNVYPGRIWQTTRRPATTGIIAALQFCYIYF